MADEPSTARILVVDDEPANVLLLERVLVRQGYPQPVSTTDPFEALVLFQTADPDLVLLDLHMPGMHGLELLARFREWVPESSSLPIVVLTADATLETRQRALAAGASDFLTKPFDPLEVGLRIRNLLEVSRLHRALRSQNERLEATVQERTRALEEALRGADAASRAKSQFLANMSHELRTPLTAIAGAIRLLNERVSASLPEVGKRVVALAERNAERLLHLVDGILDLQALQTGEVQPARSRVELGRLLRELVEERSPSAGDAGVRLQLEVPEGSASLTTDAELLRDALRRLLDNAVRFTPGGSVSLRLRIEEPSGVPARIEVCDTGIGIPEGDLARVLEPFQQLSTGDDRSHGGVGMGLSLAREICTLLGFRLELHSDPGRGTTARIVLPAGELHYQPPR